MCEPAFPHYYYFDLGAEHYPSSVGDWFKHRYPRHRAFNITAFEADPYKNGVKGGTSWAGRKSVEMLPFAVWVANSTTEFISEGFGAHLTGDQDLSHKNLTHGLRDYGYPRETKRLVSVSTIDFAEFLQRRVTEADYVAVKMDIEGAEYTVVPHLIATGAIRLIDEMFVEVHVPTIEGAEMKRMPLASNRTKEDAKELVGKLRRAGVYAHQWS